MQIGKMDNKALKQVFRYLRPKIIEEVNPDSIIHALYSEKIISFDDYYMLGKAEDSRSSRSDLFALLYRSLHPETFIQLRLALLVDYHCIVRIIDEQLTPATAQIHLGDSAYGRLVSVNSS